MKTIFISVLVLFSYIGFGQVDLNNYKYIIIPKQFDGFKKQNQYLTSTVMKHLFTQKGFLTVYDDALPDELYDDRCLGLLASLNNNSSMFTTKTSITLKDCRGDEVFITKEGKSKIKEFNAAYSEAMKESMLSFEGVNYAYNESTVGTEPITVSFKNDVKKLEEKKPQLSISDTSTESPTTKAEAQKLKNISPTVIQEATVTDQLYENLEPVPSEIKKAQPQAVKKLAIKKPNPNEVWYAQSLPNGYQLVDSSPKIRMKLLKSSSDNVYMAQTDDKSGMVYQKDGKWVFEYYSNDKLVQEELNIKF